jgi:hypothetical protein
MKKTVLLMLLVSGIMNAQETEFTFDNTKGMTDFVVTNVEGKTAPEIYKKVLNTLVTIDFICKEFVTSDKALSPRVGRSSTAEGFSQARCSC